MAVSSPPADVTISYSQQFRRCNKPDCPSCCTLGGKRHGPYWYAFWRQDGRHHSYYLGRRLPLALQDKQGALHSLEAPAPAYAPLHVRTLGSFAVWRGEVLISASDRAHRKAALLFKCLISAPDRRLRRERLIEWLWPDTDPAAGAKNLRLTVHRLRRILDVPGAERSYVRLERDMLSLDVAPGAEPPAGWLDAAAFDQAATGALAGQDVSACRAALALYGGEYLPDDFYEDWAMARREELRQEYVAVLLHLADLRERHGMLDEAARCLRTLLTVYPCHEQAARTLMRVQATAGRPMEAIRTYQQLVAALRRDLGLAPDRETQAHYRTLLEQR